MFQASWVCPRIDSISCLQSSLSFRNPDTILILHILIFLQIYEKVLSVDCNPADQVHAQDMPKYIYSENVHTRSIHHYITKIQ